MPRSIEGSEGSGGSHPDQRLTSQHLPRREDEALKLLRDLARDMRQQPIAPARRRDRSNRYLARQ